MQEPPKEGVALVRTAELDQRVERERRVAYPGVAVVPVALASYPLRERCGCRGRNRAGGRINEQLQRQCAAHDSIPPRAVVTATGCPPAPESGRRREAFLRFGPRRENERFL